MGLEPTTFCMARASGRSLQTAACRAPSKRANATEPERTPSLAILTTDPGADPDSARFPATRSPTLSG
jgi:hypothetical protein